MASPFSEPLDTPGSIPEGITCTSVLDSIADGVFTVNRDWHITSFNRSAERITGISRSDALGQKCWDVFRSSLCDGSCALDVCMQRQTTISNKSIFIIRPDGEKVPISISAAPLYDTGGQLVGGVETFRDLSAIHYMRQQIEERYTFEDIVGKSRGMGRIFKIMPQVAQSNSSVLVVGESGTGKELVARALHNLSSRKDEPLVTVNCGALPDQLLESELFGYKAGAFTDAKRDKPGRFQLADKGTIFLDEIGDMPQHLQVKLLRVLQDKTFEPLGSIEPVTVNVRILAASNQDLDALVQEGKFRQDLYYRLNVVRLQLPPLRERLEDIPLLINHFLRKLNSLQEKSLEGVSEDVLSVLMRHTYPGNVRELENILEYASIMCPSGFIQVEHLPDHLQPTQGQAFKAGPGSTLEDIKCRAVLEALERNQGKKMVTCRELGISKDTLRRMLARCSDRT